MLASELADLIGGTIKGGDAEVSGVTHASNAVTKGDVFVAIKGARADGTMFIGSAVERGAAAVIVEGHWSETISVPVITVPDARAALADAAVEINGRPAEALKVVGITGTDGKTTTSWMLHHLLTQAGLSVGLLSTVGYRLPGGELTPHDAHLTTPEAPGVQRTLARIRDAGATHVVLETSSHALAQGRVRGITYDVGVWTQLTREHLDFHKTMDDYFAAKRLLIERSRHAVLNADDPWTEKLHGVAGDEMTYSAAGGDADLRATDVVEGARGLEFTVVDGDERHRVVLPMAGGFNVANALAAWGGARRLGVPGERIAAGLPTFTGVPGRMELVPNDKDIRVVVDFAHTPSSITNALTALRRSTPGRLYIVLGAAGGLRDVGRIAPMGEAAARLSDGAWFTEDDCYDTPLDFLLDELRKDVPADAPVRVVPDRRNAVAEAIRAAGPGDTVLLAGKGAETSLERPTGPIPWSDADLAAELLRA